MRPLAVAAPDLDSLEVHTEFKGLNDVMEKLEVKPGTKIVMYGQYPSCTGCKGQQNKVFRWFDGKVEIEYRAPAITPWSANGGRTYKVRIAPFGPKKI